MENILYQIFISSTYIDLKEERSKLLNAILMLNHIPAGMELFPAIGKEQMEIIKRVIEKSDYYVLILGARYGSVDSGGISYTEREYDYAIEKGKPVIALIHEHPEKLPPEKKDENKELYTKFMFFRKKVMDKCYVAFWNNPYELTEKFLFGFNATVKEFPAIGWIRGDIVAELLPKLDSIEQKTKKLTDDIQKKVNIFKCIKNVLSGIFICMGALLFFPYFLLNIEPKTLNKIQDFQFMIGIFLVIVVIIYSLKTFIIKKSKKEKIENND